MRGDTQVTTRPANNILFSPLGCLCCAALARLDELLGTAATHEFVPTLMAASPAPSAANASALPHDLSDGRAGNVRSAAGAGAGVGASEPPNACLTLLRAFLDAYDDRPFAAIGAFSLTHSLALTYSAQHSTQHTPPLMSVSQSVGSNFVVRCALS